MAVRGIAYSLLVKSGELFKQKQNALMQRNKIFMYHWLVSTKIYRKTLSSNFAEPALSSEQFSTVAAVDSEQITAIVLSTSICKDLFKY